MAAVNVEPTSVTRAGVSPAGNVMVANDTYHVKNDGRVLLHFKNGATAGNIEFTIFRLVDGIQPPARTITLAANASVYVGFFEPGDYNEQSGTYQGRLRAIARMAGCTMIALT